MAIGPGRPFATVGHKFVSYSRVFFNVSSARHRLRTTKQGEVADKTEALRLSVLWSLLFFFMSHLFHCVSVSARILGMCSTALWPFVTTRCVPYSLGAPVQSQNPPPVGT